MKKTPTALFLSLVLVLATFVAPTAAFAEEPTWFLIEDIEHFCGYIDPEAHFTVDVDGDVRIFIHTNDEDELGLVVVHPGDYKIVDTDIYVGKDSATKALVLTKYAKGYMTPADWNGLEFNIEELCSFAELVFSYPTAVNLHVEEGELTLTITLNKGETDEYVAYESVIDSNLWSKITTVDGEGNFINVEYFFDGEVLVDIGKQFGSI